MRKIQLLAVLMSLSVLFGCSKEENKFQDYTGSWSGTYAGDDTGTWEASIDESGKVTGSFTSDNADTSFTGSGVIDESGRISTTIPVDTGAVMFEGNLSSSAGNGTWENSYHQVEGTWEGSKK